MDLEASTVRVDPRTTNNGDGRLIYRTDELRSVRVAQCQQHGALRPDGPFVFHRNGKRIRYPDVAGRKTCEAADLPGSIPHDFRRTAVRNLVRAGIPERVAMQMTGHKTGSVFDRYYSVAESDLREAAQKPNGALGTRTAAISTTIAAGEPVAPHIAH